MEIKFDSESELENFIYSKFNETGICCIDDTRPDFLIRQMNLGSYGICDLIAFTFFDDENYPTASIKIYELKKEKITSEAFSQVSRYASGITKALENIQFLAEHEVLCALVGREIDESCFILNDSNFEYYQPFFDPSSGVSFKDLSYGWIKGSQTIKSIEDIVKNNFPLSNGVNNER